MALAAARGQQAVARGVASLADERDGLDIEFGTRGPHCLLAADEESHRRK